MTKDLAATGRFPFRHLTLAEVAELQRLLRARLGRDDPRWPRYISLCRREIKPPPGPKDAA